MTNPMTIQCTRCEAYLVLTTDLLARVEGKTGRVGCVGCGEKIRLDARHGSVILRGALEVPGPELEFDDAPSVRQPQLSLLPPPPDDEAPEEIDAVESVRQPARVTARPSAPPPSRLARGARPESLPPRPSAHAGLRPPRPSMAPGMSTTPHLPADPFDDLASLAPVVPLQGVRLTQDGRLINRADEAPTKPRLRRRIWAPLVLAALLGTGLASARVGSMLPLPLGRSKAPEVKQVATLVLSSEKLPAAAAPARPVEEPHLLEEPAPVGLAATVEEPVAAQAAGEAVAPSDSAAELPRADEQAEPPLPAVEGAVAASSAGALAAPAADDAPAVDPALVESTEESSDLPEFSKDAATVALQHAAAEAMSCRQPGDPVGSARVIVTFAPSGRVTTANLNGAPYAGTATGGCIAGRFRGASVPPFAGSHVTVTKTIAIQ